MGGCARIWWSWTISGGGGGGGEAGGNMIHEKGRKRDPAAQGCVLNMAIFVLPEGITSLAPV